MLLAGHESLVSKQPFGDCQLHVEFATPQEVSANFMNRGNSGVILMGKYEVQIFDSWHEHPRQIYPDGQAASIYGQTPPLVNACMPPGAWQSYDIVFRAPCFRTTSCSSPPQSPCFTTVYWFMTTKRSKGKWCTAISSRIRAHPRKLPLVLQGHGMRTALSQHLAARSEFAVTH